jgi:nucleoside-diphosphate-sugar epimerase
MYGKVNGTMTEDTPIHPTSKKGEVRTKIAQMLLSETKKGNLKALIARSADFYGPYAEKRSVFNMFVLGNLMKGKKAQVFVNAKSKHSYTYTGDCGKALYLLAKTEDAYNQIWHLPTAHPALTHEELIKITAQKLNIKPEYSVLYKWMINMAGMFDKNAKGAVEMLYQNEYDYIFDSSKFEKRFNYLPTSYEKGIEETINYLKTPSK